MLTVGSDPPPVVTVFPTLTVTPTVTVAVPAKGATPGQKLTGTQKVKVTPTVTVTEKPNPGGGDGLVVLLVLLVAVGALAAGWAVGRRLNSSGTTRKAAPLAGGTPEELTARAAADWRNAERGRPWLSQDQNDRSERGHGEPRAVSERARLVASCADLADRLKDRQPALFTVLTRDLSAIGVTVESADGQPFDAQRHNPVGTEPTADPAADLRVATTVRLGYQDHGTVVRSPDVIVYRAAGNGRDG